MKLNFRHALQGGDILACITWPGGYQFYGLLLVLLLPALVADYSFEIAMWGMFCPGLVILMLMFISKYTLYKCRLCRNMYAGPRLAEYRRDDPTYL